MKYLRKFFRSVKNIIVWFPIIWMDRQWDQWYLYKLLDFKLRLMENFFKYESHLLHSEKHVREMHICRLVLKRLIDQEVYCNHYDYLDKKWGEQGDIIWDSLPLLPKRERVKTEKDEIQYGKDLKRCVEHEDYLLKQDINYLFLMMRKHVEKWWD